jgi:hypothetical protein
MMRRSSTLFITMILGATASGLACKSQPNNGSSRIGFILGANNILPLDGKVEDEVPRNAAQAAVLLATTLDSKAVKFCSGTMIEAALGGINPRILTNHHCFAAEDADGRVLPDLQPEACTKTIVYFGFDELHNYIPMKKVPCQPGSLHTDPTGDLGVFELQDSPPDGVVPFAIWPEDRPPEHRKAFIIHHPDVKENLRVPPGEKIALPAASVTTEDCETGGLFAENEWPLDGVLRFSFKHTCDLIHGSSGSALIDRETNMILGVNWGGMKIKYASGDHIDNVATKPSYVRDFVNKGSNYRYEILESGQVGGKTRPNSELAAGQTVERTSEKVATKSPLPVATFGCGTIQAAFPRHGRALSIVAIFLALPIFLVSIRPCHRRHS